MPELPEVETIVRSLRGHLRGATIADVRATVACLRRPVDVPRLRDACCGHTITGIRRRAKFILVELGEGPGLVLHLGMTGAFRIVERTAPAGRHERVIWDLTDGRSWRFADARRFGSVEVCDSPADGRASLNGLGVEPLEGEFRGEGLFMATRGRSRPIKNLIMDQAIIAGVGNIYASEALFRAGVRPQRASGALSRATCERLAAAIREVLAEAITAGGTTIDDYRDVDGTEGRFAVQLSVYGRTGEACQRCGPTSRVRRIVQSGRSSFYCPRCQH